MHPAGVARVYRAGARGSAERVGDLARHGSTGAAILAADDRPHGARRAAAPAPDRPGRAAPRARPARRLRRHRADHRGAGPRADRTGARRHVVRERRFHGVRQPAGADRAACTPARRHCPGSLVGLHDRHGGHGPPPRGRVRRHPRPPRVGRAAPGAGQQRPRRQHVPRTARPAVRGRCLRRPTGRPRRHQPLPGLEPAGPSLDDRLQRPRPRGCAVRGTPRRRALLRRPRGTGEGHRRGDRGRASGGPPAADRREGRRDGVRTGLSRGGLPARDPHGRGGAPRRAQQRRSRPAVRRELRHAHAGQLARAVRARRDRVARVRDAGPRAAVRGAPRDHPGRRRRLPRPRRRRARRRRPARRGAGSRRDPSLRARSILGGADGRRLRGGLPAGHRGSRPRERGRPPRGVTAPRRRGSAA